MSNLGFETHHHPPCPFAEPHPSGSFEKPCEKKYDSLVEANSTLLKWYRSDWTEFICSEFELEWLVAYEWSRDIISSELELKGLSSYFSITLISCFHQFKKLTWYGTTDIDLVRRIVLARVHGQVLVLANSLAGESCKASLDQRGGLGRPSDG